MTVDVPSPPAVGPSTSSLPGEPLADAYGLCLPDAVRRYLALFYYLTTISGRGALPPDVAVASLEHLRLVLGQSDTWLYAALVALRRYGYVYERDLPVAGRPSHAGPRMFCLRLPDGPPPPGPHLSLAASSLPTTSAPSWLGRLPSLAALLRSFRQLAAHRP